MSIKTKFAALALAALAVTGTIATTTSQAEAKPLGWGYGVGAGGQAALTAALASCAPGVVTVNIDNGFGAAIAALKMLRMMKRR